MRAALTLILLPALFVKGEKEEAQGQPVRRVELRGSEVHEFTADDGTQ